MSKRRRDDVASCRYCGRPTQGKGVCPEHRELEAADPHELASGPPLSEGQLGIRPQWKVPKRGGRGELY